ncbi:transmembrane protein 273 isoform X1 [Hyperolius riggenbachi]|uniref:transmembrane protein 273 isoform X1 n=1 Tax=Hyperolius riggenbachi TaxID=752182 RepID=UPI0035A2F8A2
MRGRYSSGLYAKPKCLLIICIHYNNLACNLNLTRSGSVGPTLGLGVAGNEVCSGTGREARTPGDLAACGGLEEAPGAVHTSGKLERGLDTRYVVIGACLGAIFAVTFIAIKLYMIRKHIMDNNNSESGSFHLKIRYRDEDIP